MLVLKEAFTLRNLPTLFYSIYSTLNTFKNQINMKPHILKRKNLPLKSRWIA